LHAASSTPVRLAAVPAARSIFAQSPPVLRGDHRPAPSGLASPHRSTPAPDDRSGPTGRHLSVPPPWSGAVPATRDVAAGPSFERHATAHAYARGSASVRGSKGGTRP